MPKIPRNNPACTYYISPFFQGETCGPPYSPTCQLKKAETAKDAARHPGGGRDKTKQASKKKYYNYKRIS